MRLTPLRTASIFGSFALVALLACLPAQGRGQQAEQFALQAFLLLLGSVGALDAAREK